MEPATFSSLDSFEESLRKLEDAVHQLTSCKPDFEQMSPIEKANYELSLLYSVNSLFWGFTLCAGVDPRTRTEQTKEMSRVRAAMTRLTELERRARDSELPRLRVDAAAAQRVVRSALWSDAHKRPAHAASNQPGASGVLSSAALFGKPNGKESERGASKRQKR